LNQADGIIKFLRSQKAKGVIILQKNMSKYLKEKVENEGVTVYYIV
jgi:flavin-dependent dehydrogenase